MENLLSGALLEVNHGTKINNNGGGMKILLIATLLSCSSYGADNWTSRWSVTNNARAAYYDGLADGVHAGCQSFYIEFRKKSGEWNKGDENFCIKQYFLWKDYGNKILSKNKAAYMGKE